MIGCSECGGTTDAPANGCTAPFHKRKARHEFRVRWQREGLSPRSALYQSKSKAKRRMLLVQGRMAEATGDDPADLACGHCPCAGMCGELSNGEVWAQKAEEIPPLIVGPILEQRDVGDWRPVE